VNVNISRDKKEQRLTMTLPERKQGRIEETMGPSVNAEMMVDLSDIDQEIAQVQPQIALAVRQVQNVRPVLEKVKAELLQQRKEIQEQVEKVIRIRAGADI
jgi:division protein CdvB (Snf7/Vps24/ESCRT-III family)